jgi:hypothetical protein
MLKIFDLVPSWVYAAGIAGLLLLCGVTYVRMDMAKAELATYRAEVAENTRKAEVAARVKETEMQVNVERIAQDAAKRETQLATRLASANRAAGGLRDEIDRLNARTTPEDPGAAAFFAEASTARKLLGTCTEEYRFVARDADELRSQVTGLQDYVRSVREVMK